MKNAIWARSKARLQEESLKGLSPQPPPAGDELAGACLPSWSLDFECGVGNRRRTPLMWQGRKQEEESPHVAYFFVHSAAILSWPSL